MKAALSSLTTDAPVTLSSGTKARIAAWCSSETGATDTSRGSVRKGSCSTNLVAGFLAKTWHHSKSESFMLGRLRQCCRLQHGLRCCIPFQQQQQQQPAGTLLDPSLQSQWQPGKTTKLKDSIVKPSSGTSVCWTFDQCPANLPHRWDKTLEAQQVVSQVLAQHLQAELSGIQQTSLGR